MSEKRRDTLGFLALVACLGALAAGTFLQGPLAALLALAGCLGLLLATGRRGVEERGRGAEHPGGRDILAFAVLLVAAALPRYYALETFPPLPNVDEGINGCIVLNILEGRGPGPVLTEVYGEEAYGFYVQAIFFDLLGHSMTSFRVVAAFLGMLCPPLFYLLVRPFVGGWAAFLVALLMCFDSSHLRYSREGNTIIHANTFQLLAFLYLRHVFVRGDRFSCLALGLVVALGCHVYPAFRVVTLCMTIGLLMAHQLGYTREHRGPILGLWMVFLGLAPFLFPWIFEMWMARMLHITWLGHIGWAELWEMAGSVPRVGWTWLGLLPRVPGGQLFVPLVVALSLVGAVEFLRRWCSRNPARAGLGFPDRLSGAYWLSAMIFTGAAGPIVCEVLPQQTRRYLLLLLPVYVLAAIGLDRIWPLLSGPRAGRLSKLVTAAVLAFGLILSGWSGVRTYVTHVEDSSVETKLLANFARFIQKEWPAVLPASRVAVPFIFGQTESNPEVQFLERALGLSLSRGLNPYPMARPSEKVHFVLGEPIWDRFVTSHYPQGERWTWGEGDHAMIPLDIWTVPGEQLARDQGLHAESGPDSRRWSGFLYVAHSGRRELNLQGAGALALRVGELSGRTSIYGWMAEGWHPIEISQAGGDGEPPVLHWRRDGVASFAPVPEFFLRRSLVDPAQLGARPAAQSPRTARAVGERLRQAPDPADWLQDLAVARDRVYEVHTGLEMLQCYDLEGRPIPDWKGLRGPAGTSIPLPREPIPTGYELSIGCSPEGDLAIADARNHRILFVAPDGFLRKEVPLLPVERSPGGVAYDPGRDEFLVTNGSPGYVSRYSLVGEHLDDWLVPGALALSVRKDGAEIYVTVPQRGGIVVLDPEGREIGFLRCTELNALTRIGCDAQGNILGVVSDKRIFAFDAHRRFVVPLARMPHSESIGDEYTATTVRRGPDGDFFLGVDGVEKGWVQVRLR